MMGTRYTDEGKWIGLFHARAIEGKFPFGVEVKGAYVNMVGIASSRESFIKMAASDLLLDDLVLIEAEEVDTVHNYRLEGRMNPELERIVQTLSSDEPIKADIFSPYTDDDS